jgi:hypothetical protein
MKSRPRRRPGRAFLRSSKRQYNPLKDKQFLGFGSLIH